MVGTFHAAGKSLAYDLLKGPVKWLRNRLDYAFAVSEDAATMAHTALGGEYEILFNGVEIDRYISANSWPKKNPTIFFDKIETLLFVLGQIIEVNIIYILIIFKKYVFKIFKVSIV